LAPALRYGNTGAMDAHKLAKVYEQEVMPGWEDRFVPFLLEAFPDSLPPKCQLLELGCTTGRLTQEIVRRLPPQGRLIAVDDNYQLIEQARTKIAEPDRKRVFFKKEAPRDVSFAEKTFDGVLGAGVEAPGRLGEILQRVGPLLRPDGFLLLGTVLQGSFQELLDIFREILEKEDLVSCQMAFDQFCRGFPDRAGAVRLLTEADFLSPRVRVRETAIPFANGLALLQSPLVRHYCLEDCLSLIKDRSWREGVLAGMMRSLDTYFPSGIELTLQLGRLEASRG